MLCKTCYSRTYIKVSHCPIELGAIHARNINGCVFDYMGPVTFTDEPQLFKELFLKN